MTADTFDLIIAGGTLIDGTGARRSAPTDLGVRGERISAIGDLSAASGGRRIDARGRVVCPGLSTRTATPTCHC
jgi:N-acyl-D-aspartate/D-glutamate deacylase